MRVTSSIFIWSGEAVTAAYDYNCRIDVQYRDEVVEMLDRAAAVQFRDAQIVDSQDLDMSGDDIYWLIRIAKEDDVLGTMIVPASGSASWLRVSVSVSCCGGSGISSSGGWSRDLRSDDPWQGRPESQTPV